MGLTLTQVQSLFGLSAGGGAGAGNAATAIPALTRATTAGAEAKGIAAEKKDPITLTAIAQFRTALDKAETVEQALSDPRVLKVLLPALGLPDQVQNAGLAKKALLSDPGDTKSLAVQLGSTWKAAAETLGIHETGLEGLRDPALLQTLTDGFARYQYRTGLDEQQPGISDALYFLDNAATNADVYAILGNSVLRRVVTGALGLPSSIAIQPVETQGRAIASRIDLEKLQDPGEVKKLAQRYLIAAANDAAAGAAAQNTDPFAAITSLALSLRV